MSYVSIGQALRHSETILINVVYSTLPNANIQGESDIFGYRQLGI